MSARLCCVFTQKHPTHPIHASIDRLLLSWTSKGMPVDAITAQGPGGTAEPYLIGVFGVIDVAFSVIATFSQVRFVCFFCFSFSGGFHFCFRNPDRTIPPRTRGNPTYTKQKHKKRYIEIWSAWYMVSNPCCPPIPWDPRIVRAEAGRFVFERMDMNIHYRNRIDACLR